MRDNRIAINKDYLTGFSYMQNEDKNFIDIIAKFKNGDRIRLYAVREQYARREKAYLDTLLQPIDEMNK
jgi:uncharacterized membrane protein